MKSDAHVLVVGRDETLLLTRKLILGTFFEVEAAGRISHAAQMIAERKFDLIVLCYSLSDEECQRVADLVRHQVPRPKILTLSALGRHCRGIGADQELQVDAGPYALAEKSAEMLGFDLKATRLVTRS